MVVQFCIATYGGYFGGGIRSNVSRRPPGLVAYALVSLMLSARRCG
jgi:hypothetical protein